MTTPVPSPRGPRRVQGASVLGGLIVGALLMGAFAPLVGTDRTAGDGSAASLNSSGGEGGFGVPGTTGSGTTGSGTTGSGTTGSGTTGSGTTGSGAPGLGTPGSGTPGSGSTGSGATGSGATGSSSTGSGATGTGTTGTGTGPLTASDVGVTAKTIKIGMINLDCKGCAAIGVSVDTVSQRSVADALVQDLNARGGINGRKIELVSADYDPVQDAVNGGGTERKACIELTKDQKVFAVVYGGLVTNACIYHEYKTPLITWSDVLAADPDSFNQSGGNLWLLNASSARQIIDWAVQLDRQHILTKSTKWGLVLDDSTSPIMRKYFLSTLKRLGYSPTHVSTIPTDGATASTYTAQEVPKMRATGVTHVLLGVNSFTAKGWVLEAQRNTWKPQYVVSDYGVGTRQYEGDTMSDQVDWNGAIAVSGQKDGTVAERRKDPAVSGCLAVYERIARRTASEGDLATIGDLCATIGLFERAATKAGPNLTRKGYVQALASTGQFPLADRFGSKGSFGGRYSLGAVKWSGINLGRIKRWTDRCPRPTTSKKCWVPVSAVYPMGA